MNRNLIIDSEEEEPSPVKYEVPNSGKIESKKESGNANAEVQVKYENNRIPYSKNNTQKNEEIVNESMVSIGSKNKVYTERVTKKKADDLFDDEEPQSLNFQQEIKTNKNNHKYSNDNPDNSNYNQDIRREKYIPEQQEEEKSDNNQNNKDNILHTNEIINIDKEENEIQKSPNPTINMQSKREYAGNRTASPKNVNNSNRNNCIQDYMSKDYQKRIKSEKSVGVLSDTSVRPRKGDKTPKSQDSGENAEKENSQQNTEEYGVKTMTALKKNLNNDQLLQTPETKPNKSFTENKNKAAYTDISRINPVNNQNMTMNVNNNTGNPNRIQQSMLKTNASQLTTDKNYNQYDIQQLSYDLVKEYSHLRIDKDEDFMRRMLFDIFKRQTKEERMHKLIERNKVKIDETDRIKTFNRLIDDANRRLEAQEKMDELKHRLDDNVLAAPLQKKYKFDEWEEIYEERFVKPQIEKDKWVKEKIEEKMFMEKQKEEEIVQSCKTKKLPQNMINQTVKRLYEEAERRKLRMEEYRKKDSHEEEEYSEDEGRDIIPGNLKKEREMTPSKFKKYTKVQKYNFQSDMSGNEKSNTDDEKETYLIRNKKKSKSREKKKPTRKSIPSANPYEVSERLYQQAKKPTDNKIKKNPMQSNTEFNNRRFEKDRNKASRNKEKTNKINYNNDNSINVIKEESYGNKKNASQNNIKSIQNNPTFKLDEHLRDFNPDKEIFNYEEDEEEEIRSIPKPIEGNVSISAAAKEKMKLHDLKKIKSNNSGLHNNSSSYMYMPDFKASKLVNEILMKKLEEK